MKLFDTVSSIEPGNSDSWEKRFFLTFDIDWAHDEVLRDTIDLVEQAGVKATWFVTHNTPLISRLRDNRNFELGIHPNFNGLLDGSEMNIKCAEHIVSSLKDLVPEAVAVRSHSLVHSERLCDIFLKHSLVKICNQFIPKESVQIIEPWKIWDGLEVIPHCWQDNVAMRLYGKMPNQEWCPDTNLQVLDFHPIHVYLNTDKLTRYEGARSYFHNPRKLLKFKSKSSRGTRNLLMNLLGTNA